MSDVAPETGTTLVTDASLPSEAATQQAQPESTAVIDGQTQQTASTEAEAQAQKPAGAPEKYEFTFEEGQAPDPSVLQDFTSLAKELDLPQDKAQAILSKMSPVIAAQNAQRLEAASKQWAQESTANPEFGGAKLQENLGIAKGALDKFGTPKFVEMLNQSGLGNHPEVIGFLYRAGKAMSSDSIVTGGNATPNSGTRDLAKAFYPNMN
jgi:hypothetical protein